MPAGRPRKIDDTLWTKIEGALFVHATEVECADLASVSVDTIESECKRRTGMNFAEYSRQKRSTGKVSLRRLQFAAASKGNPAMLIWLGKHWLDQWDKVEQKVTLSDDEEKAIEAIKQDLKQSLKDDLDDGRSD
jgi:hypothetical protein